MTIDTQPMPSDLGPRRDFLILTAGAMIGVGAAAALWPFIDSMNPAADVLAAGAPIDVDISQVQPGQQIIVLWRSRPIFIVNRTAEALKTLQDPQITGNLRDPDSAQHQQPDYVVNWHRSIKPEWLVLVGICTHLGCIPAFTPNPGGVLGTTWPGGYFCPCHGSRYDLAGRVFKGVPAAYNLPVPPYRFVADGMLRIGENEPGSKFNFEGIDQI
jgi:ubiquinol-cytochrome c reductase iron-sulfur subunit